MPKQVLAQYLARYAEPEAGGYSFPDERYSRALVIPMFRESARFLQALVPALDSVAGRVLVVVVVNASAVADDVAREHQQWIRDATNGSEPLIASHASVAPAWLVPLNESRHRLLVVDRAQPPWLLPPRQAVGLARKIGFDMASGCYARGQLCSPWIYSTDADATLAPGHFDAELSQPGARIFPFVHLPSGDEELNAATWAYECSLRYHVLGLHAARSPYAWHALGSALAVHVDTYARVRGFPKRAAAEDFYLLQKVAKLAPVHRARRPCVGIRSRRSERVPVGTGPAVVRLLQGQPLLVEAPAAYCALGELARAVERAATGATELMDELIGDGALRSEAQRQGLGVAWQRIVETTRSPQAALRRWAGWFDGLKARQLLRALRSVHAPLGLEQALREAPFVAPSIRALAAETELTLARSMSWRRLRDALAALESEVDGTVPR